MRVYIPSMGRAGRLSSSAGYSTNNFVKEATFVVPPAEAERYARVLNPIGSGDKYEVLACEAVGIAETRQWIGQLAKKRKEEKFCMMDDDLRFGRRIDDKSNKLMTIKAGPEIQGMLDWIDKSLSVYAHVSVSPRQGNNTKPAGDVVTLAWENKRTLRVLAYRTKDFLGCEHGRVPVMEDFDVNLQLLEKGLKNCCNYWWTNDQVETGTPGGCSTYRTLEAHNAAAVKIQSLHPKFIKLREKENKIGISDTGKAMKNRLEVTIQWVEAWKSSQVGTR